MTKRLLAIVGLGSLLVFAGLGILGWIRVKEHVELHLRPDDDATDARSQAILLLAEDVKSLRSDLDGLASALDENFQRLDQAIDERAAAREEAVRAELRAIQEQEARARREMIDHLVDLLGGEAAERPEPALIPDPTVDAEPVEASPPTGESRSFLSFRLPSKGFSFDDAQEWVLLDGLSRVGFDAKTTLHDFSAATTAVTGGFRTNLGHPEAGTSGRVTVRTSGLDSQEKKRDEDMLALLDAARFPDLVYEIERFEPRAVDAVAGTVEGRVIGRMTIRDRSRELAMDVHASLDASKRLLVEGEAPLRLSDYGVEAPNKLGLIKMEDEVKIWIGLRARSAGRARTEAAAEEGDVGGAR